MNNPVRASLIFGALLATCAHARAASRHDLGLEPLTRADAAGPTAAGLTTRVDPVSGQLVEPDVDAMRATTSAPEPGKVQIETRADGSTIVRMNGAHMSRSVASMRADGSYEETCIDAAADDSAEAVLEGSPRR
jgi:hypothetical protein